MLEWVAVGEPEADEDVEEEKEFRRCGTDDHPVALPLLPHTSVDEDSAMALGDRIISVTTSTADRPPADSFSMMAICRWRCCCCALPDDSGRRLIVAIPLAPGLEERLLDASSSASSTKTSGDVGVGGEPEQVATIKPL